MSEKLADVKDTEATKKEQEHGHAAGHSSYGRLSVPPSMKWLFISAKQAEKR